MKWLLTIYSSGYAAVFGIFALMYRHVHARRAELGLTRKQVFETGAQAGAMVLHLGFGLASVIVALIVPSTMAGLAGLLYFLIGPAQGIHWWQVDKRRARILA